MFGSQLLSKATCTGAITTARRDSAETVAVAATRVAARAIASRDFGFMGVLRGCGWEIS